MRNKVKLRMTEDPGFIITFPDLKESHVLLSKRIALKNVRSYYAEGRIFRYERDRLFYRITHWCNYFSERDIDFSIKKDTILDFQKCDCSCFLPNHFFI